ncbi:hypothetical protein GJ672_03510 [Spiribacter sp. 2438]|uniref:hypothetical protein n=1 Tax=Spiribacter sp. 2438 TaxID=2666185 RepID=UPI0012B01D6B|nr:hypothetical protein [Spiribacter sp. 2438]QGM21425.1 hypothetical protein GJ672_03510 [Spiribacter sp. 2438]
MNKLEAILAGDHVPRRQSQRAPRKSRAGRRKSASVRGVSKLAWLAVEFERWRRGERGRRKACDRVARRWQGDLIADGAMQWPWQDRRVSSDTIRTIWNKAQIRRRRDGRFRADCDLELEAMCYAWSESKRTGEDGASIYADYLTRKRFARRFGYELSAEEIEARSGITLEEAEEQARSFSP